MRRKSFRKSGTPACLGLCFLIASTALWVQSCPTQRPAFGPEYAVIVLKSGQAVSVTKKRMKGVNIAKLELLHRPRQALDRTHPIIDQWIQDPQIPGPRVFRVVVGIWGHPEQMPAEPYLASFEEKLKQLGKNVKRYGFVPSFGVDLPVSALRDESLRGDSRVRYIQPDRIPLSSELPPSTAAAGGYCKAADGYGAVLPTANVQKISEIAADTGLSSFFNSATGRATLLDSGVVSSHSQLPAGKIIRTNCLTDPCESNNATDGCLNHGSPNAGILVANGTGDEPIGLLPNYDLDSFKVIEQQNSSGTCTPTASVEAILRALGDRISQGSNSADVILIEGVIEGEPPWSCVSVAADQAFNAGFAVITPTGNLTLDVSPANAHRVLPVSRIAQNFARTSDNRILPALWTATSSETTSGRGGPYCKQSGASGAAPFVAGAAAKLNRFLQSISMPADPGSIYAVLLGLAKWESPERQLFLTENGNLYIGSFQLDQGGELTAEIEVGAADQQLHAAIWWPESLGTGGRELHNEVHLELRNPSGLMASESKDTNSVFQYVASDPSGITGNWKLRFFGANIASGGQLVYWAAYAGP